MIFRSHLSTASNLPSLPPPPTPPSHSGHRSAHKSQWVGGNGRNLPPLVRLSNPLLLFEFFLISCLQVLKGSHKLGRLTHGVTGTQAGADMERVAEAEKRFELVFCEMEPGDVLFTHSNLLHTSAPNESDSWRRSMIVAYNGRRSLPTWCFHSCHPSSNFAQLTCGFPRQHRQRALGGHHLPALHASRAC